MVEEWPYEPTDDEPPEFMREDNEEEEENTTPEKYKPDTLGETTTYEYGQQEDPVVRGRVPARALYHLGATGGEKMVFEKDTSDTVIFYLKDE